MGDVWPVPGGGVVCRVCMVWDGVRGVLCGVWWCGVFSVRAGGGLFKTRTQYQRVLGKTGKIQKQI